MKNINTSLPMVTLEYFLMQQQTMMMDLNEVEDLNHLRLQIVNSRIQAFHHVAELSTAATMESNKLDEEDYEELEKEINKQYNKGTSVPLVLNLK